MQPVHPNMHLYLAASWYLCEHLATLGIAHPSVDGLRAISAVFYGYHAMKVTASEFSLPNYAPDIGASVSHQYIMIDSEILCGIFAEAFRAASMVSGLLDPTPVNDAAVNPAPSPEHHYRRVNFCAPVQLESWIREPSDTEPSAGDSDNCNGIVNSISTLHNETIPTLDHIGGCLASTVHVVAE